MRVVLAALFVFASMLGTVGAISSVYGEDAPWWSMPAILGALFASMFLSMFVFNRRGFRPDLSPMSLEERITRLDSQGLVLRDSFRAVRAFAVEEFEDEGSTYYVELEGGRVLYLTGQYLYDFEPITDDPEVNQSRRFPCTEFEILRHKEAGYVLDIHCAGRVLEPEIVARPYTGELWGREFPEDGNVIVDKGYEQIKRAHSLAPNERV